MPYGPFVYVGYQIIIHNIIFLTPQKIKDHDAYQTNYCGNSVRDQQDGPYKMHELDGCVDWQFLKKVDFYVGQCYES